ncbi:UDP-glucose/GDP-mannose dehydrogenase family protein [Agrococcus sp. SCSIO52902]|uniref:UDP-glucose dehydrogenase family protein n=1 Tax=Agrococcus sp. SCSIO52902 TaxID=2933290 RepID=UPI001FF30AFC|nr:UDP-glucose/GDP-mannose dehydrogenase family protein [Agrococcus sp. SCSIO52902]UOW01191.1 UDP-glucose/GDP-mannose dehydrogenase family protein [Agrococcus sp. SCSIO52902]
MKIAVIGCGYLGAVHAAAMASLGYETIGVDVDEAKVERLRRGEPPFFEPGLPELLRAGVDAGTLRFTTDVAEAAGSDVVFVAVGTPQRAGSDAADLTYVDAAVESLLPHLAAGTLVAGKSTVPVGTAQRLADLIAPTGATLAWNPEFLREGFAVEDTLAPDRLVYGVADGDDAAVAALDAVYARILERGTDRLVVNYATAELVKVSANAFLATKISFINAMAELSESVGADVTQLADAIGLDARIGRRFLNAGLGFGGGCLPKDIRAFQARADELGHGETLGFLREVDRINLRRRDRMVALIERELERVGGDRVAMLGLAFKPNSDDVRDSPALDVSRRLQEGGRVVRAYDPEARETALRVVPGLEIVASVADAVRGADVLALGTEWQEFRDLDPAALAGITDARVVVDGRNALDAAAWSAAGFRVIGLGRPEVAAA